MTREQPLATFDPHGGVTPEARGADPLNFTFYLVTHQGAAGALLLGQTQCRGARMNRVLTPALFHTRGSDELTYPAR